MVVSEDKQIAIVGYFRIHIVPLASPFVLRLKGLDNDVNYDVALWEEGGFNEIDKQLNCGVRSGAELTNAGLTLDTGAPFLTHNGDYFSQIFLAHPLRGGISLRFG
jgi:hypothetical protein